MKKYAKERERKKKMNGSSCVTNVRKRGRLIILGSINRKVRDLLIALRNRGGIVSSAIAIIVAKAFIQESCDKSVKNLCIRQSWAQSLFGRMEFVRRMSTIAKFPIPDKARKEIGFVFMHKIVKVLHTSSPGYKCRPNPFLLLELQTSEYSRQYSHKPWMIPFHQRS